MRMSESSSSPQAVQYLLAFEEWEETEELLSENKNSRQGGLWFESFLTAYITQDGNGAGAVHAADAEMGKARRSETAARKCASKFMKRPAVKFALAARRKQAALEAALTAGEYLRSVRMLQRMAAGVVPMRKSIVSQGEKGVETMEVEVYNPSLSALGKATEIMGKTLGVFKENLTIEDDSILQMTPEQQRAHMVSLAKRMGLSLSAIEDDDEGVDA